MSHLHRIFLYKVNVDLENHSGQNILSMGRFPLADFLDVTYVTISIMV